MTLIADKLKNLNDLKSECARLKSSGQKVVFTNGCFDLLHPGHTRYLRAARAMGHFLVVGLNSDRSVRAIKGAQRPIQDQETRAELLSALECVDAVILFDEETPYNLIRELAPDVLVKGGDWHEDEIVGADLVKQAGGKVERIPYVEGFSTSGLIRRILESAGRT
jgi:D-beta-D-heptose 7-phosphate kinase/D-beta-D-heptose 1-phosphate adenosyltransferase